MRDRASVVSNQQIRGMGLLFLSGAIAWVILWVASWFLPFAGDLIVGGVVLAMWVLFGMSVFNE